MKIFVGALFSSWCFLIAVSSARAQTKATVTLYVNAQHPQAADSNPGTETLPLKTIKTAATAAVENNKQRISTQIIIFPGTYRESIDLGFNGQETETPIIFEDRRAGASKVNYWEVLRSLSILCWLGVQSIFGLDRAITVTGCAGAK